MSDQQVTAIKTLTLPVGTWMRIVAALQYVLNTSHSVSEKIGAQNALVAIEHEMDRRGTWVANYIEDPGLAGSTRNEGDT